MVTLQMNIIRSYIMLYCLRKREGQFSSISEARAVKLCSAFGRLLRKCCFDLRGFIVYGEWSWGVDSAYVHYSLIHQVALPPKETTGLFMHVRDESR